jgi:hypothetical protein
MRAAWPTLKHVFSVRRHGEKLESAVAAEPDHIIYGHHRYSATMLTKHQVDLLAVERGYQRRPMESYDWQPWETVVVNTNLALRPRIVIEMWPSNAQLWSKGPACKSTISRWHELGYVSRYRRIEATQVGGAITQARLVVARVSLSWSHLWEWGPLEGALQFPRPMSNLLVPAGLLKSPYYVTGRMGDPDAKTTPMPGQVKAYISTEKGVRRLLPEETGNGLGIPKQWKLEPQQFTTGLLDRTTSIFHWEYLASNFSRKIHTKTLEGSYPTCKELQDRTRPLGTQPSQMGPGDLTLEELRKRTSAGFAPTPERRPETPFSWKPPNLRPDGEWYADRMSNARKAATTFPDPDSVISECVETLKIHRDNYNVDGPAAKKLGPDTSTRLIWSVLVSLEN